MNQKNKNLSAFLENEKGIDIGRVISSKDNILKVKGLKFPKINEVVLLGDNEKGLIFQYDDNIAQVGIFTDGTSIVGDVVRPTNEIIQVGFSEKMLGRVIDFEGNAIDEFDDIIFERKVNMERDAQSLISREPVNRALKTGILSIDSIIPLGRGQRELIIGDRETGKTQIAIDTIVNQAKSGVICIYVSIAQKLVKTKEVYKKLKDYGVLNNSIIMIASPSGKQVVQYLTPYAATSIAEEFMAMGRDVLIVYDDLSKHADTYRSISLMLDNPPGREAFPGDIFYLHSRLLERSANIEGGGSLTALPIVETQEGDISAYIPTNIIGITDGQIFTNAHLFKSGFKPAVDLGLSVSRVGSSAQNPLVKSLAKGLNGDYARFVEIKKNSFSGGELVGQMAIDFKNGEILEKIFVQYELSPLSELAEATLLYAYRKELVDSQTVETLITNLKMVITDEMIDEIESNPVLNDATEELIKHIIRISLKKDFA